jgi:hypothetical protein
MYGHVWTQARLTSSRVYLSRVPRCRLGYLAYLTLPGARKIPSARDTGIECSENRLA